MTKLTIEDQHISVTIKVPKDDMLLREIINELFVPALNGVGYSWVQPYEILYLEKAGNNDKRPA